MHLGAALYAIAVLIRRWKWVWAVVLPTYLVLAGVEGVFAGSIVGGLLGGVYNSGLYRMNTWIPAFWGLINTLVLIVSGFAIQGGL